MSPKRPGARQMHQGAQDVGQHMMQALGDALGGDGNFKPDFGEMGAEACQGGGA